MSLKQNPPAAPVPERPQPQTQQPQKVQQIQLVGRKIRQLRKEHKLTQVELSTRLGIQQSDLSRMEQGEYRVSLDTLFRILAEFKMGMGEFFEEIAQESITPRDVRLVESFNTLPHEAQREVEDFIAFKKAQTRQGPRDTEQSPRERETR
ncbi:MAG TPA: helix-turn-helix transcriptional regulator [Thermoanaerobaculia bacterium]